MTQAGPAIPVITSTDPPAAGPALRVAVVADGRPTEAGPARRVVVVSDGRPTQGNEPLPVVVATGAQASGPLAGSPIPVVVVSGSLNSFSPSDISGLIADWNPSALALNDGDAISSLTDTYGGHHATGTTTQRPTFKTNIFNGYPAARFNGTSNGLQASAIDLSAYKELTIYIVATAPSAGTRILIEASAIYSSNAGAFACYHNVTTAKVSAALRGNNSVMEWTSTATLGTIPRVISALLDMGVNRHEGQVGISGDLRGSFTSLTTARASINTGAFGNYAINIGSRNQASLWYSGDIGRILLYGGRHTAYQREQVEAYLAARYGATVTKPNTNVVFEGDSLTEGDGTGATYFTTCWPINVMNRLSTPPEWSITGVSGYTVQTMAGRAATVVLPKSSTASGKNVLFFWGGTNDLYQGASEATTRSRQQSYLTTLRAAGFYIIFLTMLPRQDTGVPGTFETDRQANNTYWLANYATYADDIIDIGAHASLQNPADTTYYDTDKAHLNATGHGLVADMAQTKLTALGIT